MLIKSSEQLKRTTNEVDDFYMIFIICSVLNFYCNITVILIAKGNK